MESKHQEDLREIRKLMEQSTRFISLSGLSGIIAGCIALLGAFAAYWVMKENGVDYTNSTRYYTKSLSLQLYFIAIVVLVLAVASGYYFTIRKSKKLGLSAWTKTSKLALVNLAVPLITGGIFCFALIYHNLPFLIAPAMLIFYGLALVNVSKYTLGDVKYLGYCEIVLGLIASFVIGYGLIFWALGFGVLHIIYGIVMYNKYDK